MYQLVKIISLLVRQFLLPNPLLNLIKDPNVAEIVNLVVGGAFVFLSYILTGAWYDGEFPVIGSIGFLVNYILLTALFIIISKIVTSFYIILVLFVFTYVILFIIERKMLGQENIIC